MKRFIPLFFSFLFITSTTLAQVRNTSDQTRATPTIAEKIAGMERYSGYFNFYWDAKAGKIWLEIDKWNSEFLYVESLPAGIGSNDIGLDRGELGQSYIVRFERTGPRVMLIAPNYGFRATTENPDERRAVKDAFAESTLWGFEVAAEEGSRVLVDATAFYLRDAHRNSRHSATIATGDFPPGSDAHCLLSRQHEEFSKEHGSRNHAYVHQRSEPGPLVRSVTPMPQAITVREHDFFCRIAAPRF